MKKLYLILILGVFLLISACQKFEIDPIDTAQEEEVTISMENLVVADQFNWKTHNDIIFRLTGNADNKVVEVISSKGIVYQKAYLQDGEAFDMKVSVPTYETSVSLVYNNKTVPVDISNGNIEYSFE